MNATTRSLNPELFPASANPLLDADERVSRTNAKNDGKSFQREIEITAGAYQNRRKLVLRKVDPPARIFGRTQAERRVVFLSNPFLDFLGCWEERQGRALFVECKSTATHRLPFKRSGGLTEEQLSTIKTWRLARAAVCVLWRWNGRVTLWTPEMLVAAEAAGAKSLVFADGKPVGAGEGKILWDFLPVLAAALWPKQDRVQVIYRGRVIYYAPNVGWLVEDEPLPAVETVEKALELVDVSLGAARNCST